MHADGTAADAVPCQTRGLLRPACLLEDFTMKGGRRGVAKCPDVSKSNFVGARKVTTICTSRAFTASAKG